MSESPASRKGQLEATRVSLGRRPIRSELPGKASQPTGTENSPVGAAAKTVPLHRNAAAAPAASPTPAALPPEVRRTGPGLAALPATQPVSREPRVALPPVANPWGSRVVPPMVEPARALPATDSIEKSPLRQPLLLIAVLGLCALLGALFSALW